jgi:thermitase
MRRLLIVLTAALLSLGTCLPEAKGLLTNSAHARPALPAGLAKRSFAKPEMAARTPGQVIVKLKADRDITTAGLPDRVQQLVRASGIESEAKSIKPFIEAAPAGKLAEIVARRGLDRICVLKFDPATNIDSVIEKLEASGRVEYAEPNYLVKLGGQFIKQPVNDPDFLQQWGLSNPGFNVNGYGATPGDDIAAPAAWQITTGSPDVVIAVVDTGIDVTHPDLAQNIYSNAGPPPTTGFNVADDNSDVSDVVGHGTQMAGIIAAVSNNAIGIAGICQCKVLPVRFFAEPASDPSEVVGTVADAAKGIIYAIGAGASIINASWEVSQPSGASSSQMQALKEACNAANDADVLMVCIAGNDGFDNDDVAVYPGHYELPNQIVVAASDYNDNIWRTTTTIESGYGVQTVQLAAPGVSIISTQARGSCALCSQSQTPADWYTYGDGTSGSAAFVSAVAGLVKSQFPEASAQVMRRRILAGVNPTWGLQGLVSTGGRLNAYNALTVQLPITPPVLTKLKYKAGKQTLVLFGTEFQQGAHAIVGGTAYLVTTTPEGTSPLTASVPATAFPVGTSVPVMLRNPDGGISQTLTFSR